MEISQDSLKLFAVSSGVLVVSCLGYQFAQKSLKYNKLRKAILEHREIRQRELETLKQRLEAIRSEKEDTWSRILELKISELQEELNRESVCAVDVLNAFQWKALEAHERTNCLIGLMNDANELASELDRKYKGNAEKPPLFGIPVSVKASFRAKGYRASRGYAQDLLLGASDEDTCLIEALKEQGAVPFVLTNVPQTLLTYGSSNPVYGVTSNPHNTSRSSGGSSSGEGALIAAGGSLLGIGSDTGGSIRVPAHFCGIAGLKPCGARSSVARNFNPATPGPGRSHVTCGVGPMGPTVECLAAFCRAIYCASLFKNDIYLAPLPFRCDIYEARQPLRIGWFEQDGWFPATPPCAAAVRVAKQMLEAAGHQLVAFMPPDVPRAVHLFNAAVALDSGKTVGKLLKNDIPDPYNMTLYRYWTANRLYRYAWWLVARLRYPNLSSILCSTTTDTRRLKQLYAEIEAYQRHFTAAMSESKLDCLVCPAAASPALPIETAGEVSGFAFSYSLLYNLLDYTAGVVPIRRVSAEDISEAALKNFHAKEPSEILVKAGLADSVGLPVAVQVVAPPFSEELVLRIMKEIEAAVGKL